MSTVSQPNTIETLRTLKPHDAAYIAHLIRKGNGWEDLIVKCSRVGIYLDDATARGLRGLRSTTPARNYSGAAASRGGRFSAGEGAGT